MGWSFLDFTGLSHFFGKLPEKLVTTDTTQTISGTKSFSSTILGSISGSAASAAKDGVGNVIADTYETKADAATHLSKSDAAGTYLSKTDAASAYVQTAAVDQTIAGTKTFSKPIVGSVTGNAATATKATKDAAGNTITTTYATKAHTHTKSQITDFPALATVATSGSYTDLANKPAIPTVNNATLTIQKNGTTVKTFTANASANVTANITVPTKVSELTNDSGFLTSHQSLSNYVTLNGAQTISGAKTFTGNIIGINKERSTEDANSLYSTTAGSKLTYYTTSNGGTTLTNVPAKVNTTLESRTIRILSDSDWIVEQICHNSNGLYYRKGSNGTWGAWKTFAFTDSNISGNAATATTATTAKACTGNAATATKATQDSDGNKITTTYSKNGHTHDDRYYTETEVNNLLKGKANTSHNHNFVKTPDNNHTISFDWSSQVSGFVGLTVDATKMGGIVTTAKLRAQWYAAYPDGAEAHNAMWGGRDITAAFNNGTVSANIKNGTFRDIFPGDYITKQVTIPRVLADDGVTVLFDGGTYTVNWVIADCDYWINKGNTAMTAHHVAIVPQAPIFNHRMNATNTTADGYAGSEMYRNIIPACARGIVHAFGSDHILEFRDGITNGVDISHVSSGIPQWTGTPDWWGAWALAWCNLMSEKMVYGAPICAAGAMDNTMATRQMSAFRLSQRLINYNRQAWWLRDVVSSVRFASSDADGSANATSASSSLGVRPFALLC